jgi:hypothetical protein
MIESMKNETEIKLKIGETIKQTIFIYKTGFKQFMILSLIAILPSLCMAVSKAIMPILAPVAIVIMILSIFLIYFLFRANAGFFLLTRSILQGELPTIKESFRQTEGYAGTYFAISLLYGLILILPIIGIALSYSLITNSWAKFGITGLLLIPLFFLATRYSLAVASALFADEGGLKSSKLLVKGDFVQVLIITVFLQGIIIGISWTLATAVEKLTEFWLIILAAIAAQVFQILTAPICSIAPAIMYHVLNQEKGVDASPLRNVEQNIAPVLVANDEAPGREEQ